MKRDMHHHFVKGHTLLKKKLGSYFKGIMDILPAEDDYISSNGRKTFKKYGCVSRETWSLDSSLAVYLYEHIKLLEDLTIADIDSADEFCLCEIPTWASYLKWSKNHNVPFETIKVTLREALDTVTSACLDYLRNDENEDNLEHFQYGLHVLAECVYMIWW